MTPARLSPRETIDALLSSGEAAFLDVRSEGEFAEGSLPRFLNAPILNNEERKQVGTTYKQQGQEKAIELGVALTQAARAGRIEEWLRLASRSQSPEKMIVACWRGGLRSRYACEWLQEKTSTQVLQVEGGYKGIRKELAAQLDRLPSFIVVTGFTGARKSELLQVSPPRALDLETFAHHRGSAFGEFEGVPQPSQSTFENRIFLRLAEFERRGFSEVLVEDESVMVGKCTLPTPLKFRMNESPTVQIDGSVEDRVSHLVDEYALEPLQKGVPAQEVHRILRKNLLRIQKGLGGLRASQLIEILDSTFVEGPLDSERHAAWIRPLLVEYYDRHYGHYLEKLNRPVLFRGNFKECTEWIQKRFD